MLVYSACLLNDRGGAAPAVRPFTSACGQSIYRSDKFPAEERGTYYVCDPTIHVVRRARLAREGGLVRLQRTEPEGQEFLRSSDINCRFVNTAEGPDGCLYVTDMYRGIIQDAPWLNPQSRANIRQNGLHDNRQHGRIWRIRHEDHPPRGRSESPKMSRESSQELLRHLGHPAGWWRDTAQRELILRDDRETVVKALEEMAQDSPNESARFHALWTLEGMDRARLPWLSQIAQDESPRLRRAVIQIAETHLADTEFFNALARPLATDIDATVIQQLVLSLGWWSDRPEVVNLIERACRKHGEVPAVQLAATLSLWGRNDLPFIQEVRQGRAFDAATTTAWMNFLGNWDRGLHFPEGMPDAERRRITGGETQYFAHCIACHGADGKGVRIPGADMMLAPDLTESARLKGAPENLIPLFLHGLTGPIAGRRYGAGFMASAEALGITREDRLSELISYLRFAHGNQASSVSKEAIIEAKRRHAGRRHPWTDEELRALTKAPR